MDDGDKGGQAECKKRQQPGLEPVFGGAAVCHGQVRVVQAHAKDLHYTSLLALFYRLPLSR